MLLRTDLGQYRNIVSMNRPCIEYRRLNIIICQITIKHTKWAYRLSTYTLQVMWIGQGSVLWASFSRVKLKTLVEIQKKTFVSGFCHVKYLGKFRIYFLNKFIVRSISLTDLLDYQWYLPMTFAWLKKKLKRTGMTQKLHFKMLLKNYLVCREKNYGDEKS